MATQQLLFDSNKHNIHHSQLIPLCRSVQKSRCCAALTCLRHRGNGSLALVCRTVMPIARQADGLWVYLDSSEPEQRMPLKQLQQQHGHEVVGALLITAVQPKDDSCNVASRLPGRPPAAASTSIRSVQVCQCLYSLACAFSSQHSFARCARHSTLSADLLWVPARL